MTFACTPVVWICLIRFRLISLLLLVAAEVFAGSLRLTVTPQANTTQEISWALEIVPEGNTVGAAAVQWSFHYDPALIANIHAKPGTAAVSAGKSVQCASHSRLATCMVWGINQHPIPAGELAIITYSLRGPESVSIPDYVEDVTAASANGERVDVTQNVSVPPRLGARVSVWAMYARLAGRGRILRLVWLRHKALVATAILLLSALGVGLALAGGFLRRRSRLERRRRGI